MTSERSRRVEELFHLALGRGPDERASFLTAACADDAPLRSEVERLLDAADASEGFLEEPAVEAAARFASARSGSDDLTIQHTSSGEPTLHPGQILNGRWVIERKLAQGGIGEVYLARDSRLLDRPVVVKTLLERWLQDSWMAGKFQHEMEALTRVEHRGVVGVLDADRTPDGTPYLVMQYVDGVDLGRALSEGPMELSRVGAVVREVGRALDAAHRVGVLHRDLKPSNIMLRRTDEGPEEVKLIDFGIAKVENSRVADSTDAARSVGSISYMSPEQLRAEPLTPASDVYALGVIAYEMATGRKPFKSSVPVLLSEMQRAGAQVSPRQLRPEVPEAAQEVILKALSFRPEDRHQSAREFGDDLAEALAEAPRPEMSPGSGVAPPALNRRRPFLWAAVLSLALAACVAVVWMVRERRQEKPPTQEPAAAPELALTYWVDVQKVRNGRPHGAVFRLPGEIIFEKEDRLWLGLSSLVPGHLYVINERPATVNGLPQYNLLFPLPSPNGGASRLEAGQEIKIPPDPEQWWFEFDDERGTEKLWIVFSAESVPELEAARRAMSSEQDVEIADPKQISSVREFIERHGEPPPHVEREAQARRTMVTAAGGTLLHQVPLEHY